MWVVTWLITLPSGACLIRHSRPTARPELVRVPANGHSVEILPCRQTDWPGRGQAE